MKFEKKKVQSKLKTQKDYSKAYPMFAFRIPQTPNAAGRVKRIRDNVETIYESLKAKAGKEHKVINRNDIILEALEKGLMQLKKNESA